MFIMKKPNYLLFAIFVFGLILRLFYFPNNVYFSNDQARDAYYSYEIVHGDFKVIGPGASFSSYIHHGVLYYYIMGPIYFLAQGSPYIPALLINILNAIGIFVVFLITKKIFNKRVGLIAAFLFAISFEQTQYALFFSHPGLAPIFVLLYYLGLTLLIFEDNPKGLVLSAFCAGIATQFHFSLIILVLILPIFVLIKPKKTKLKRKDFVLAVLALALSSSTYIVAEIKFGQLRSFIASLGGSGGSMFSLNFDNFLFAINRYVFNNLVIAPWKPVFGLLLVTFIFWYFIKNKKERTTGLFLLIWFLAGSVLYILTSSTTFYYGMEGSVALLIAVAAIGNAIYKKNKLLAVVLLAIVAISNFHQIFTINRKGPVDAVMAPAEMLLSDEQRAIDYIYTQAGDDEFSIHGLTIPYNVKSTWDYLFNWYGMQKYGFVPVWGGEDALGSEGTLEVVRARSSLPSKQFLIVEPLEGLESRVIEDFFKEESYFTNLISEKKFGAITVQTREKY